MKLDNVNLKDAEKVRIWRNECLQALRTPFPLTKEMQENFYNNVISNRQSNNRFWAIRNDTAQWSFIGMIGIINIEWENRIGEISIVIDPSERGKGIGIEAVKMLLTRGFYYLNLFNIYGECYECNESLIFWKKICKIYNSYNTILPARKYYNGEYYDSFYFNIKFSDYHNRPKK